MGQPHAYLWGWSPARLWGCQRCCIWSWSRGSHAGSASPRRRTGRNPCTGQLWGPCSGLFWQLGSRIGEMNSTDCPGISGILRTLEVRLIPTHHNLRNPFFCLKMDLNGRRVVPEHEALQGRAPCAPLGSSLGTAQETSASRGLLGTFVLESHLSWGVDTKNKKVNTPWERKSSLKGILICCVGQSMPELLATMAIFLCCLWMIFLTQGETSLIFIYCILKLWIISYSGSVTTRQASPCSSNSQ